MKNIIAVIKKRNVIFVGTCKRLSTSNKRLVPNFKSSTGIKYYQIYNSNLYQDFL